MAHAIRVVDEIEIQCDSGCSDTLEAIEYENGLLFITLTEYDEVEDKVSKIAIRLKKETAIQLRDFLTKKIEGLS